MDLFLFVLMSALTGLSITGGYHRLFAHRTYRCNQALKILFLGFGAAALQNSALSWSSDHRDHHRYVDNPKDPYSIKKGFFWAHMGWIFYVNPNDRTYDNAMDLSQDRWVIFQHKHYGAVALVFGLLFPLLLGVLLNNVWGALVWGVLARVSFVHHATFLINSAAHVFGKQPYTSQNSARDNAILAFFTFGEGYHNFHHTFAADYRNGIRWWQWDPTKWLIYICSSLGLASDLTRTKELLIVRARLQQEKTLAIQPHWPPQWNQDFQKRLDQLQARVEKGFQNWQETKIAYRRWKRESRVAFSARARREKKRIWRREMRYYRKLMRESWVMYRMQLREARGFS